LCQIGENSIYGGQEPKKILLISPGKNQISAKYRLRIHGKSQNYRYVDGTPTPAKIQISHFLKVGQFYIDVYSICDFGSALSFIDFCLI
jgi:hypothetical protein